MSTVSAQAIEDSLKQCMDPEVPLNIVEMGLIYGIDVTENNDVNIKMTMTTQGCPLHQTLVADATRFAKKVPGVNNVKIDIVWEPAWSMDKMTEEGKLKIKEMGVAGSNTPDEIFEFCDTWNGNIPIIAIPTSYPTVTLNELQNHNVKMVIYANQSLRCAHFAMANYLKKLSTANSLDDANVEMSSMEDIFHLQEMYKINSQEIDIERDLKKLGYIN